MKEMSDSEIMDMIDGLNEEIREKNAELRELKQTIWLMYKKSLDKITYAENIELDTYWTKYYEGWE